MNQPVAGHYPDLDGCVAVVTGASGAIGAATARALIEQGARVALLARDRPKLEALAGELGGNALAVPTDCTDEAALTAAADTVRQDLGPVRLLFAFAGGAGFPVPTLEETVEHWRSVLDSELTSAFLSFHAFGRQLVETEDASVVLMSSSAGRRAARSNAAYAAAKGGIVALTRHLAAEHAAAGVRVNCLAPGAVLNAKLERAGAQAQQQAAAQSALGRLGTPADVADAALFLASRASGWLTGQTVDLDGGRPRP